MAVKERVFALLQQPIADMGYELIEVTYQKEYGTMTLTLYIDTDKEGGISLDDCEAVSKCVDPLLDADDPTAGVAYNLNVSSPGLDRPIKTERDFRKKQGTKVEVGFYRALNGVKKVQGILVAWDSDTVTIAVDGNQIQYKKQDIAVIKPVIEF